VLADRYRQRTIKHQHEKNSAHFRRIQKYRYFAAVLNKINRANTHIISTNHLSLNKKPPNATPLSVSALSVMANLIRSGNQSTLRVGENER